jgi:hypothetical protein
MSDTTYVPEHKLRQQASAARVTIANVDLHGPNHHRDKVAPAPVRCEAAASAVPSADLSHAARTADRAGRPAGPIERAWPFNPEDTSPLAWRRTLPSDRLRDAEALLVNTTLAKIGTMRGGGAFTAALLGEVGAAVAVALA